MDKAQAMVDARARKAGWVARRFYHGTPNGDIEIFNTEKESLEGSNTQDPNTMIGSHFAEDKQVAQRFVDELYGAKSATSPKLFSVYLKLENPLGGVIGESDYEGTLASANQARDIRRQAGELSAELLDFELQMQERVRQEVTLDCQT